MAYETISPNMNLTLPGVTLTDGPQWASDLNSSLTRIDSHDHSSGAGVPVTPSGLNISSDLSIIGNNITTLRSLRFSTQSAPLALSSDLGCLYESGVDLYFNDGNGNQVRMTQSGAVAGTPGSIASLTSPASATYVSANGTFVWQSDANTAANMDGGSVILRNITASSYGLTLNPPNAMAANFSLTLPSIPASQKFMTLDSSGNMSAPWAVDGSTLEISTNTLQVKDSGISTAKIADLAITNAKLAIRPTGTSVAAGGVAISASSGTYGVSEIAFVLVTNLSVTIVATGTPVYIGLVSSSTSGAGIRFAGAGSLDIEVRLGDNTTVIAHYVVQAPTANTQMFLPSLLALYAPSAGSVTYNVFANATPGSTATIIDAKLVAYGL